MGRDFRSQYIQRYEQGMADIRISRHNLRRNVIVSLRDVEHDIYMDVADSTEEARINKQAIVVMNPDMYYVQEQFDNLDMPDDILPFVIVLTMSGMPRQLHMNDWVIVDGKIYVISKVKPTNRELGKVLECLVYPMRDSRLIDDPLAIYKIRFRIGLLEIPWMNVYGQKVVMELIYGGCPLWMSFNGNDWQQFYPKIRVEVPGDAQSLFIMDESKQVASLKFGEEWSTSQEEDTSSGIITL